MAGERRRVSAERQAAACAGELFFQRELAASLQYMADEEAAHRGKDRAAGLKAARDAFYRGDIAQKIARYHREHGGWVTLEDLRDVRGALRADT